MVYSHQYALQPSVTHDPPPGWEEALIKCTHEALRVVTRMKDTCDDQKSTKNYFSLTVQYVRDNGS